MEFEIVKFAVDVPNLSLGPQKFSTLEEMENFLLNLALNNALDVQPYSLVADFYFQTKDWLGCQIYLDNAKLVDRQYSAIWMTQGMLYYYHSKKRKKALDSVLRSLELNPDHIPGWKFAGQIALQISDRQTGAECLQEAIDRGTDDEEIFGLLVVCYLRLRAYDKCARILELMIERWPSDVGHYINLGSVEILQNNLDTSEIYLKKALAIDSTQISCLKSLMMLSAKQNNRQNFQHYRSLALKINPHDEQLTYFYEEYANADVYTGLLRGMTTKP